MFSSPTVDHNVRQSYLHPVAAAWHQVSLTTTDAARLKQLQVCQEVLLRSLASLVLADYLRGPPAAPVEALIERLGKPSMGHWLGLLREALRATASRPSPAPFFPDAIDWYFRSRGRPSDEAKRLERLVQLRNEDIHDGSLGQVREQVETLQAEFLELFAGLRWLSAYRLLRVLETEPTRSGGFRGSIQFFAGITPQSAPLRAEWTAPMVKGAVYCASPCGTSVLEVSPFFEVYFNKGTRGERLYQLRQIDRDDNLVLVNESTGARETKELEWEGAAEAFSTWLGHREELGSFFENEDRSGTFEVPGWGAEEEAANLGERFEARGILGEGGMAVVYRVWDRWDEQEFALKLLQKESSQDPTFVRRFKREARAMRKASHPHILRSEEVGHLPDGRVFLKLPLMEGGSLRDRTKSLPQPEELVLRWGQQMLEGLAYLHANQLLHRDVKPSNYLLDDQDNLYLTDFGIALQDGDQRLTRINERLGSLTYMAPEARSGRDSCPESDVYSVAVILEELLTGEAQRIAPGKALEGDLGSLIEDMGSASPKARPSAAEALERLLEISGAEADSTAELLPAAQTQPLVPVVTGPVPDEVGPIRTAPPPSTEQEPPPGKRLVVGRHPPANIVIPEPIVSGRHLEIGERDGELWVCDLGSVNGTRVDGVPVEGWTAVPRDSSLRLGSHTISEFVRDRWLGRLLRGGSGDLTQVDEPEPDSEGRSLTVGRAAPADIIIDIPSVSTVHIEIQARGGLLCVRDLGSTNGTYCDGMVVEDWVRLRSRSSLRLGSHEVSASTRQRWLKMLA